MKNRPLYQVKVDYSIHEINDMGILVNKPVFPPDETTRFGEIYHDELVMFYPELDVKDWFCLWQISMTRFVWSSKNWSDHVKFEPVKLRKA